VSRARLHAGQLTAQRLRDAEVHDLGDLLIARVAQENVVGLEIAMDQPLLMHEGHRSAHIREDATRLAQRNAPLLGQATAERLPLQ
jgi:hypothetical protein